MNTNKEEELLLEANVSAGNWDIVNSKLAKLEDVKNLVKQQVRDICLPAFNALKEKINDINRSKF